MKTTKEDRQHIRRTAADPNLGCPDKKVVDLVDDFEAVYASWHDLLDEKAELERKLARSDEMRRQAETKCDQFRSSYLKLEGILTKTLAVTGLALVQGELPWKKEEGT